MKIEIGPFTKDLLADAGRLLAQRHKHHRALLPEFPSRFEDVAMTTKAIETLFEKNTFNGFAALRDGNLVAYLIGETMTQPWGRSGYVYLPGCALAEGESPALIQDLYALLGEEWVKRGCFNHYLYISAADKHVINALFDLGFGKERVDALLDLRTTASPEVEEPVGVTIRRAGKGDNEYLGSLSDVIMRALAEAPYWHPTMPEDWQELREGWSELADEEEWTVWLALENGEALGTVGFRPEEEADTQMLASPRTVYLSVAATLPEARGRGISTVLTWHGLEQARKEGYEVCYTNWISPNLLASRFWPRFGFKDAAYRLAKKVDPSIAWTRGF
ncbi:MAG TPA: GNAT family N-acetyltransferase [Anaerolineales bacterium]|nr:GNAT family N-acetyltransferase [Anaerolineales bacterium]